MSEVYEIAIKKLVLKELSFTHPKEYIEVFHRKKYIGKRSRHHHEIDLSCEIDWLGTRIIIAIECKAYRRSVGIDDMLEFAQRLDDISAHKGIFVSTNGYASGAIKIAKAHRIALFVVKACHKPEETGLGSPIARSNGRYLSTESTGFVLLNNIQIVPGYGCIYVKPTYIYSISGLEENDIHQLIRGRSINNELIILFRGVPYVTTENAESQWVVPYE